MAATFAGLAHDSYMKVSLFLSLAYGNRSVSFYAALFLFSFRHMYFLSWGDLPGISVCPVASYSLAGLISDIISLKGGLCYVTHSTYTRLG